MANAPDRYVWLRISYILNVFCGCRKQYGPCVVLQASQPIITGDGIRKGTSISANSRLLQAVKALCFLDMTILSGAFFASYHSSFPL